ncbi:MAG: NUDIX hydrolase [Myxococcota bacterium]
MPYFWHDGQLCIVVVTNREGDRWVLPKGRPKSGVSHRMLAQQEAWEEAGLSGTLSAGRSIDVTIRRHGRRLALRLYPMHVEEMAPWWPEHALRQRRIVSAGEAQSMLSDRGMTKAVSVLMRRLQ